MNQNNYANAFSEVLDILFHLPQEDFEKIPPSFIRKLEENSNPDYEFLYDPDKTLDEQDVLDETKTLIALICKDFLATPEEKQKILEKEKFELEKFNKNDTFD